MKKRKNYKLSERLLVMLFLMGMGLITATIIFLLIGKKHLLAMITLQDVMVFILPAVLSMALFYHRPMHVMGFDKAPSWKWLVIVVAFYFISLPGMNWLVHIN